MPAQTASPWPHRHAWVLACAAFLLICAGATVTTYDAGMAVPDWPTTYGYWFYPIQRWLSGSWDVFLEHVRRMAGVAVGLIVIALVVVLWRLEPRKWIRWLGVAALAGVIAQGMLGGFRVWWDSLLLAKVQGCTAPLFFALCAALVAITSQRWQRPEVPRLHPPAGRLHGFALLLTVALYVQIVLGAQLRHLPPDRPPEWSVLWVWLKLITAGLIALGVLWLLIRLLRQVATEAIVVRRAKLLGVIFCLQLLLGAGTWITNYGLPVWFKDYIWAVDYTVVADGRLQVLTTTTHAALGALNVVAALSLLLWSRRLLRGTPTSQADNGPAPDRSGPTTLNRTA